jgi:hypothetical protein
MLALVFHEHWSYSTASCSTKDEEASFDLITGLIDIPFFFYSNTQLKSIGSTPKGKLFLAHSEVQKFTSSDRFRTQFYFYLLSVFVMLTQREL